MADFESKNFIKEWNNETTIIAIAAFAIGLAVGILLSPAKKGLTITTSIFSNNRGNGSNNGSQNGSDNRKMKDN